MGDSRSLFSRYWFVWILLGLAALAGLTWANYVYASENPGGNDFLVHWVGTRALVIDGISPYSDEVALDIQTRAYGRPAQSGEHELRVAYPLYSVLVFLPYALITDFTLARAVWMTTLEVALVALAFSSLRLTRWKLGLWALAVYLLFSLLWYHSLRPLINGNAVILVALLIGGALLAIRAGRDEMAGVLLAFSTIKPQVVVVVIVFILLWTIFQRRWKILFWFVVVLAMLSALAALFVIDWPLQNLREIMRYSSYNPPGTLGSALATWMPGIGRQIGWVITGLLVLLLLGEWGLALRKDFRWFLWTTCLTLTASQWIGIQTDPGNFIVLLIAIVLIFAVWEERAGKKGRPVVWILMGLLFLVPWAIFLRTVNMVDQPIQSPIMFFPLPLYLFLGLYWVRWWATRPTKLLIEDLQEFDQKG